MKNNYLDFSLKKYVNRDNNIIILKYKESNRVKLHKYLNKHE